MKKLIFLLQLTLATTLYSGMSYADHGWGGHHGHHRHHGGHHGGYGGNYGYRNNFDGDNYYPQPQGYYPQQQNYQPQYRPDPRSHQGLAGGVVGSVLGYEIANGNPLAAGLGAAAGAYVGNGMAR